MISSCIQLYTKAQMTDLNVKHTSIQTEPPLGIKEEEVTSMLRQSFVVQKAETKHLVGAALTVTY